ncbi:hypothetical protein SAMN06297422_10122, partial [Lachnospiraceae bacterium]
REGFEATKSGKKAEIDAKFHETGDIVPEIV